MRRDKFRRSFARDRGVFIVAEPVERLGEVAPARGVAQPAFKPFGKQGSRFFGLPSTQSRVDQHFPEQIALRMAAADAPDLVSHRHKLANRTAMVAAPSVQVNRRLRNLKSCATYRKWFC